MGRGDGSWGDGQSGLFLLGEHVLGGTQGLGSLGWAGSFMGSWNQLPIA